MCTIVAVSTATADGVGVVSTLTAAASFSMTDTAGNAQTTLAGSPQSVTVTRNGEPDAPVISSVTAGNAQVVVALSAPANNGAAITDYIVQYSTSSGGSYTTFADSTSTSTSATVTGLTNGTAYYFKVAATNSVGTGSYSAASAAATPATVPGAPTIGAVAVASATSVTVNCTTSASNGGETITTYTATAVGDATKTGTLTSATCGLITVTGLTSGTAYTFTVTATSAAGTSAASAASASVIPVSTPGAPTTVVGTAGNTTVALTWVAPATNGAAISDYVVQYSTSPSGAYTTFADGLSTGTSATVTGLTNGTAYYFKVAATNSVGTGSNSDASMLVTPVDHCAIGGVCMVGNKGPGGGVVFYVQDAGGTFRCGATLELTCKYLEAAPTRVKLAAWAEWSDSAKRWSGVNGVLIGATAQGLAVGTGYKNTEAIVAQSSTANRAATVARAYRGPENLLDWYLPSKDELNQMCKWQRGQAWVSDATICNNTGTLNSGTGAAGFDSAYYSISSESAAENAWQQGFQDGGQGPGSKNFINALRAVRAF